MKVTFKKICSVFAVSMLAATSSSYLTTSATNVEANNKVTFSAEEINEPILLGNKNISAGSYAITMSISNNSGFSSSAIKVEIPDGYTPVMDGSKVYTELGTVLEDAIIYGANNGNTIFICTASANETNSNGELYTFYVENNNASERFNIDFDSINFFNTQSESDNSNNLRTGNYTIGDVNNDGYIDAVDSSKVLAAIAINGNIKIKVSTANSNLSYYFPTSNIVCARSADPLSPDIYVSDDATLDNSNITTADANDILRYYALVSTDQGDEYPNQSDGFCGITRLCPHIH